MPRLNYAALKSGMVFHSHADDIVGKVIQWAVTWGNPKKNTENHSGFIVSWDGQLFAAEVDGSHFRINSLEKYGCRKNRIVSVFELVIPDNLLVSLEMELARKVRKDFDKPYDYIGAISSAPWFQRWTPWLRQNSEKEFCSEVVYVMLRDVCHMPFPLAWMASPPNPLALADWMRAHPESYRKVEGVYV